MPVSKLTLIEPVINALVQIHNRNPIKSILDVGCGTGLYGALIRQYLEFAWNQMKPEIIIDGFEPFEGYYNPNWQHYNFVHETTVQNYIKQFDDTYDVILACDVLEHMLSNEAVDIAQELYRRARTAFIMTTPSTFRNQWQPPGNPWQNELEEHKCVLTHQIMTKMIPGLVCQEYAGGVWMGVVIK